VRLVTKFQINIIISYFKAGGIVCIPTDTLYALSCSALHNTAISRIYRLKKRDQNKSLSIFVENLNMLRRYAHISAMEESYLKKIWPGSVTMIVRAKNRHLSSYLYKNDTLAARVPNNALIKEVCKLINAPIIATSANISGQPSIVNELDARKAQFDNTELFIKTKSCTMNEEPSTIITLGKGNKVSVIRRGVEKF
jgi:L-threonylcarbamoyladenylate synthase